MSIDQTKLDEAKRVYLETVPSLMELRDQCSAKSKIISAQKKVFKTFMKQNNLTSLPVGDTTFRLEEEEKVTCTITNVEKFFPDNLVVEFKEKNKKRKTTFKESRD